jgi:hypothetical protein
LILKSLRTLLAAIQSKVWLIPLILPLLLLSPIVAFGLFAFATFYDILGGSSSFPADATHVPMFYVPKHRYSKLFHSSLLMALGTIFGSIHCAGWHFPFPTYVEQKLWRVASLVVTIFPIAAIPFSLVLFAICSIIILIVVTVIGIVNTIVRIIVRFIVGTVAAIVGTLVAIVEPIIWLGAAVSGGVIPNPIRNSSEVVDMFFTTTANPYTTVNQPIKLAGDIIHMFFSPTANRNAVNAAIVVLFIFDVLVYASARLLLLGLALALLNHQPPSAFIAVDWTKFYPHV